MLDHLKILSFDSVFAERLYKNHLLKDLSKNKKFSNQLDQGYKTKNTKYTYIKAFKEILFCFFTSKEDITKEEFFTKLEILIKPHYYFNNNLHNANDFSAIDCIKTLTEIKNTFDLPIDNLSIINIEFGLNSISPIDGKKLISYTVYQEKNEFINSSDNLRFSKISFKYKENGKANEYKKIKFYSKGVQFPQYANINTLRFEIKSKESKYIKTLGIYTYIDLLRPKTYLKIKEVLKKEFKKVLILDIDNKGQNLSDKELLRLNEYKQGTKWIKSIQGSRNLFSRHKADYFKLLNKTKENIHTKLYSIIDNKLTELLKGCADSTTPKKMLLCADSNYIYGGIRTPHKTNRCFVTGVDLRLENENAKYIKTTTLNYLQKYDVNKFVEVCGFLLQNSNPHHTKYEDGIISHLYKQVRNKYYNARKIKKTGYNAKIYYNQYRLDM